MSKNTYLFLILIFTARICFSQDFNVIIEVNGEIITSGIINMQTTIENNSKSYTASYVPGQLTLSPEMWKFLESESEGKFRLNFQHQTFDKQKSRIAKYTIDLSTVKITSDYLIIKIYDFNDKQYRKWYGKYTDGDYLVEFGCNGCGIYPRYR